MHAAALVEPEDLLILLLKFSLFWYLFLPSLGILFTTSIGKRNLEFQYQMNDGWVKSVDEERDPGVLMPKDLKFS